MKQITLVEGMLVWCDGYRGTWRACELNLDADCEKVATLYPADIQSIQVSGTGPRPIVKESKLTPAVVYDVMSLMERLNMIDKVKGC